MKSKSGRPCAVAKPNSLYAYLCAFAFLFFPLIETDFPHMCSAFVVGHLGFFFLASSKDSESERFCSFSSAGQNGGCKSLIYVLGLLRALYIWHT